MTSETDSGIIRLIIESAVLIALFSLLAGIGLAINAGRENAVIVASAGALLSVPASCLTGLFGLLAKVTTTRESPHPPAPSPAPLGEGESGRAVASVAVEVTKGEG